MIIEANIRATYNANQTHAKEKPFRIGDLTYLSMTNLNLPKWQAGKLAPKYTGPFRVTKAIPEMLDYKLELTPELVA